MSVIGHDGCALWMGSNQAGGDVEPEVGIYALITVHVPYDLDMYERLPAKLMLESHRGALLKTLAVYVVNSDPDHWSSQ